MLVDYSIFSGPAAVLGIGAVCLAVLSIVAVIRSQRRKPVAGRESMIGQTGTVTAALKPEGTVLFNGELWHARTKGPHLEPGTNVTVVKIDGLTLGVKEKEATDD
ncbi:MAG: hypothetical protein E4G93_01520 [Dehalococcoidia bacterium]|nr:MAG: hypothetical protein E4G93_01520 [Dehalococcoidia bacterium]